MKRNSCGWRSGKSLGRRSFGRCGSFVNSGWRRGKARMKDEGTNSIHDYMTFVSDAASFEAFQRHEDSPLLSAEASPESNSLIDFRAFAQEYPDKLFPLLAKLRPEFIELFGEYWLLGKSQAFIGKAHGFIQTRCWQMLRIIEQAIGSMIILGPEPTAEVLRPILRKACVESTDYGSLTDMILLYASTRNYKRVAASVRAPVPTIRKIFRPTIQALLASKDINSVAVGAYLRSLTHHASLSGQGLSKSCKARYRRIHIRKFTAPASETSPVISFGHADSLGDTPWCLLEISSEDRMEHVLPIIREQGKKIFGKKAGQIFAPLNADGDLQFGYIFARSASAGLTRKLTRVRGIGEMSTLCNSEGEFTRAVTIPNDEVQTMIANHVPSNKLVCRIGQFVRILTGEVRGYHGTITDATKGTIVVRVNFPTGRRFVVDADPTSVLQLDVPVTKRTFWGATI